MILTILYIAILTFSSGGLILTKELNVQTAILYENEDFTGDYRILVGDSSYVPFLTGLNFNNKARSFCLYGTWIFYESDAFSQGNLNGSVDYQFAEKCNEKCGQFTPELSGSISSALSIGDSLNYKNDSLTLFTHLKFRGVNFRYYQAGDVERGDMFSTVYRSLIITGKSKWTLLLGEERNKKCIEGDENGARFIEDLTDIGVNYESIKGLVKGCN